MNRPDDRADAVVTIAQPVIVLHGRAVALACGSNGDLRSECLHGLFAGDTRVLSTYRIAVGGCAWQILGRTRKGRGSAEWTFQNPRLQGAAGEVPSGTLFFRLRRRIEGALHDDLWIRNFGRTTARFRLSLLLDADFADIFLVKDQRLRAAVGVTRHPVEDGLLLTYERKDFQRGLKLKLLPSEGKPAFSGSGVFFDLALEPQAEWSCCIEAAPEIDGKVTKFAGDPHADEPEFDHDRRLHKKELGKNPRLDELEFRDRPRLDKLQVRDDSRSYEPELSGHHRLHESAIGKDLHAREAELARARNRVALNGPPLLQAPFRRGQSDLHALAIEHHPGSSYVVAGVPWFMTLFGRDSLMTALMAGIGGVWPAEGALAALAQHQAETRDDWRDAEPGKLPHEIRRGELAHFNEIPHAAYYGSHDAPALYCLTLWNAWKWTGSRDLLKAYFPAAVRALEWSEKLGDRDGDGLLEYETRSSRGYENQGWKDAGDAIVHADGSLAPTPLATIELQGYLYAARLAMAELHEEFGNQAEAARLRGAADSQRKLVETAFWMENEGSYALAIDGKKRRVESISSNPGHLLWSGLPRPDRARSVAERLLADDMFSGWGLRTLSTANPAFNPLSYQLGSVWPHDTAIAASGIWRYGLFDLADALLSGILHAAVAFEQHRLPELFCGFSLEEGLPVPYEKANAPQSWSAAVPLLCAQLFLGIVPDAPRHRCYLSPRLPSWLPHLELRNIRVGEHELDVHLRRDGDVTKVEHLFSPGLDIVFAIPQAPLWGRPV